MAEFAIRLRFSKQGRAKYISHLDLMRCLQRAVCRAELPISYSGGFHPRMNLSFATTLPLGFTSTCEILEFGMEEAIPGNVVQEKLNAALPSEIQIQEYGTAIFPFKALAYATYKIVISDAAPERLAQSLEAFLQRTEILTEKKTKKGTMKELDLKPEITLLKQEISADAFTVSLRLPCGSSKNISPLLVLEAWKKLEAISFTQPEICRTGLFTEGFEKFF